MNYIESKFILKFPLGVHRP